MQQQISEYFCRQFLEFTRKCNKKHQNNFADYSLNFQENARSCVGNCGKEEMRQESILYQAVRPPVGFDQK